MGTESTDRWDDADTIFFARELEQVKAKAYEKRYQELEGRNIVPPVFDYDPAVETITYESYESIGVAALIENYATDFRRVDTKSKQESHKVKSFGDSVGWTFQDIRRARMAGKPLEARKVNAARRAILLVDDKVIAFGDTALNFTGVLNHPNVPIISAIDIDPTGAVVTAWALKTGAQLLADLMLGQSTVHTQSSGVEQPDTLVLPPSCYALAAMLTIGQTDTTILEHFLKNQKFIRNVISWFPLETAGAGGTKRALFYKRDPDYLEHPIPQDFETPVPPQWKGGELETLFHARFGGVIIRFPLAMLYMDGL